MKNMVTAALLTLTISAHALADTTAVRSEKVLQDKTYVTQLLIHDTTFIPNIMGYACPLPAVNIEPENVLPALNHRRIFDFGVTFFALRFKDPNMRFCEPFPNAQKIFGDDFKVGATLPLHVHKVLKVVEESSGESFMIETIEATLNGVKLDSSVIVSLDKSPADVEL